MTLRIEDLIKDVKAYRNTMVARNFPHQEITNLIMKWDQKVLEETPEYKERMFAEREQEERENLERISREAREEDNLKEMAKQWPEYTLEELKKEQELAEYTEKFKEKDEN